MPNLKSIKKNLKPMAQKLFPPDMYSNIYGSIVICAYILTPGEKPDVKAIKRKWKLAKRTKKINWTIEDKDFIKKTLDFFGIERPAEFPVAFVAGKYNCLFAPYISGKLYPLREDGAMGITLESGKIYPLDFNSEEVSA